MDAFAYLPCGSYHARHVFRGWLKAEMQRLLTHSSNPWVWLEECSIFYEHLGERGYPAKAIDSCFLGFNWNQGHNMLAPQPMKRCDDDSFFDQYQGCVFSSRDALGVDQLRGGIDLSLDKLRCQGDVKAQELRSSLQEPSSRQERPPSGIYFTTLIFTFW